MGEISRNEGFTSALDLFWDIVSVAVSDDRAQEIALYYEASLRYAKDEPAPEWALATSPCILK
ncbi:hypothetical protein, partial [Xenorhabdus szentirmaii]